MSREDLETLFLANLKTVESILGALARRHRLTPDASDEFDAWAKMRLIENDYAILAKFRGESSLGGYLTVVLAMLYREYRTKEWGRWRPSAIAKRSGPLGIRLETLILRDGMPVGEAGQLLRTSGDTTLSDREIATLVSSFPKRTPLRPVQPGLPLDAVEAADRADQTVVAEEAAAETSATKKALDQALLSLGDEDRLLVRLHYLESMSVADIARGLALPQKPLYRRLERAIASLRKALERAGVSRERVRTLAADPP